jgi:1-acyl-sn-glycerol-3-phosphate acyltransferase
VPHDIFVNFTRSIERGTRHRNAHSVSKNPTPNPRALFPFGTREPIPGSHRRRPSSAIWAIHFGSPARPVAHVVPRPSSLSRENDPDPQSQPPARLRSSSGSPSSASCSWSPSCTKRRRS